MSTLLIERAHCLATQDDAGQELKDASVWVCDGRIEAVLPDGTDLGPYREQADEDRKSTRLNSSHT